MSSVNSTTSDGNTRTKTIARNSAWTSLDTLTSFLSSLLLSIVVARKLGPENLGHFNYVIWITALAGQLGYSGIGAATRKYVAEHLGRGDVAGANAIVRHNLRHQIWIAAAVCLTAAVVILFAVPPDQQRFTFFAAASLFPLLIMVVYGQALNAAENFRAIVISSVISTLFNLTATFTLLAFGFGLVGVTFSLFLTRTIDLAVRALQFHWHFPKAAGAAPVYRDETLHHRMKRYYWQSSLLLLLNIIVWDRSELVILKMFSSIKELAFYSLSFNISSQILSFPQLIAASAGASLMVQYGRDSRKTGILAATTIRYMSLLAFPALLGVAAVSGPLLRVLYGSRYVEAIPVLTYLAILTVPRALLLPAHQQLSAFERQSFLLMWGTGMAVFNIGLDLILIRNFGAVGAAWANGVAQALASSGIIYYAVRRLGVTVNFSNLGRILLSASVMALAVAAIVRILPPLPALVVGIPIGFLLYLASLRMTGALLPEDHYRFSLLLSKVPARWRVSATRWLRTLIPQPSNPAI